MKIVMIGEAATHRDTLSALLSQDYEIIGLPRDAASAPDHDGRIAPDDVVVSLRFSRAGRPPAFRMLHVPGAGLDGIDFASLPEACTVCNVFEHETAIAEFVLLAMLEWRIRPGEMRARFSRETWSEVYRNRVPHGEILGNTLGLIGFGRIGRAIAARARAFGMRIIAVDAVATDAGGLADALLPPARLPEMLAQADFVVIACPLSEGTRGLIDAAALGAMKPSGVLINISRAEIADEGALHAALRAKAIAGAFLDVWYRYPKDAAETVVPSTLDFHALPNVYATPHSSAWTDVLPGRRYGVIAENIHRLAAGEPLLNLVRAPAGAAPRQQARQA
jgi:phosphoglycerate dehydrogenase-like enzyme